MLRSIIEAALNRRSAKKAEETDAWKRLIIKCSEAGEDSGNKLDAEAVVLELEALGRTVEELNAAVVDMENRKKLIAQLDAASKAEAELPALRKKLDAINSAWAVVLEKHDNEVRSVQFEITRRNELILNGASAQATLRNQVGESAQRLLDGVQVEISQVRSEIAQLQRDQDFHEASMLENERNAKNGELSQHGVENLKPSREKFKARAAEIASKQADLERLVDKESELLKQAMFSPIAI